MFILPKTTEEKTDKANAEIPIQIQLTLVIVAVLFLIYPGLEPVHHGIGHVQKNNNPKQHKNALFVFSL